MRFFSSLYLIICKYNEVTFCIARKKKRSKLVVSFTLIDAIFPHIYKSKNEFGFNSVHEVIYLHRICATYFVRIQRVRCVKSEF